MRKEIIVAILVGIIFGGIFAFGIRRANVALKPSAETEEQVSQEVVDEEQDTTITNGLTVHSPEQNDVFTEDTVTITGITKPKSTVIISGEKEDFVLTSDESGEFSQEIDLTGGLNTILVGSYSGNVTVSEKALNLVFTTELEI